MAPCWQLLNFQAAVPFKSVQWWHCDLNIHRLLETYVPGESTEYFMDMGASGPFGCVFADNDKVWAPLLWETHASSIFIIPTNQNTNWFITSSM
jgi:hypothetical protein